MRVKGYVELASAHRRRTLARSLDGTIRSLDRNRLPGASPLNRRGLWLYEPALRTLAARVGDFDRPVSALGLTLVHDLLTDAGSPLYDRDRIDELPGTIETILAALEVS